MEEREIGGRVRGVCPHCDFVLFRNPVPGVAIIVEMEDGVVLVRRKYEPLAGQWCLPGGFIELEESVEEAAVRECKEETNLDVELIDLFGVYSFPDGPRHSGLVIFYSARPVGGELRAGNDAQEVAIFPLDDLPHIAFRTHRQALARLREQARRASRGEEFPTQIPGIHIRRARPEDETRVLELLPLIPANKDLSAADLEAARQRLQESTALEVLVAEADEQVVGFLVLSFLSTLTGPSAWIDDMVVDPAYRRQGIGGALIEAAVRRARGRACSHLFVNTSRCNPPVRAFYRACGFEEGVVAPLRIQ